MDKGWREAQILLFNKGHQQARRKKTGSTPVWLSVVQVTLKADGRACSTTHAAEVREAAWPEEAAAAPILSVKPGLRRHSSKFLPPRLGRGTAETALPTLEINAR